MEVVPDFSSSICARVGAYQSDACFCIIDEGFIDGGPKAIKGQAETLIEEKITSTVGGGKPTLSRPMLYTAENDALPSAILTYRIMYEYRAGFAAEIEYIASRVSGAGAKILSHFETTMKNLGVRRVFLKALDSAQAYWGCHDAGKSYTSAWRL